MDIMDAFLVVATVALIVFLVLLSMVAVGIWRLVNNTAKLMATADSGLTTIKDKILDADVAEEMQTAKMLTQGVLGITRMVFSDKKKKKHTK
jgi:hypothetical protein